MEAPPLIPPAGGHFIAVGNVLVYGRAIDGLTRCAHYHSALDILAIKFACCGRYYPCRECHDECADHPADVWPSSRFGERAILCGACGKEHTIVAYLANPNYCPTCKTRFNPRCSLHHHLYFALDNKR